VAILLDFDGTAARRDVGSALIGRFARDDSWKVIDNDYEKGRIGSRAAYRVLEGLLDGDLEDWTRFALAATALDPGFPSLVEFARGRAWRLEIVSDGLASYIQALLGPESNRIPVRANEARFDAGQPRIATPHMNPLCGRCGTCKAERVRELSAVGYQVVYVGDGYSDFCAGPRAHRLFAKGVLAEHCRARAVPFDTFETLRDVARALAAEETHLEPLG
jgi:2,3-diketo-5-methylthio-1-phosphopentane phosphatase